MDHILKEYLDFIFLHAHERLNREVRRPTLIIPAALNGEEKRENTVYTKNQDWVEAQQICLRACENFEAHTPIKKHARYVLRNLREDECEELRKRCLEILGKKPGPWTLYHTNGRSTSGKTYDELVVKTALEYNKVSDLCNRRREYYCGWSVDKSRALAGRKKRGPKPKPRQEATDGTCLW